MDTNKIETTNPTRKRERRSIIWFSTGAAIFLLCLAGFFIHEAPVAGKFAWLDPSIFAQPGPPGPLVKLRRRLQSLPGIASLMARYRRAQPNILIATAVWSIPPGVWDQAALGPPIATNPDGMRVWILPAAGSNDFNVRLKEIPGAAQIMMPRILILNGTHGQVQTGNWVKTAGGNLFGGLVIAVAGKVVFSSVKLSVGVTATQLVPAPSGGAPMVKTNLTAGCQVVLANNGALVIDGGTAHDDTGKVYWLVVSPSAVDARGQPIGLK